VFTLIALAAASAVPAHREQADGREGGALAN